nr:YMGG-like glycine zipper-containing protein [uncultured Desulfobulbus sp.]
MRGKRSIVVMVLCALLALVGCTNIKDDGTRTRAEGAGTGAVIGAVAGGILGQLIGGDTQGTLVGAAIGAAVGGAGGYAYGNHVANQKAKYAQEEDWLDACIAQAQQKNAEMVAYNQDLGKQIAKLKRETAQLKKQYKDKKVRTVKLKDKKAATDSLIESANKELASAEDELKAQKSVRTDAAKSGKGDYAKELDVEIVQLKKNIKELEKRTEELASMSASMSV